MVFVFPIRIRDIVFGAKGPGQLTEQAAVHPSPARKLRNGRMGQRGVMVAPEKIRKKGAEGKKSDGKKTGFFCVPVNLL